MPTSPMASALASRLKNFMPGSLKLPLGDIIANAKSRFCTLKPIASSDKGMVPTVAGAVLVFGVLGRKLVASFQSSALPGL